MIIIHQDLSKLKLRKDNMEKINIEFTKKELDFLYSWLEDDLDLQIENKTMSKPYENLLKRIVKKFRKEVK